MHCRENDSLIHLRSLNLERHMTKIIVPVDGSEASLRAVRFAGEIASKLGGSVVLLHVLDKLPARQQLKDYLSVLEARPLADEGEIDTIRAVLEKSGEKKGRELLVDAEKLVRNMGIEDVSTEIHDGDPATKFASMPNSSTVKPAVMSGRTASTANLRTCSRCSRT